MIRFGLAGNSDSFYEQGLKHTWQAAAWLRKMGLNAFEYPFGRGVTLKEDAAQKIAGEMRGNGIAVSAHAPYFINLANPDPEKHEASINYILQSAHMLSLLGGEQLVVHVGARMKLEREEAVDRCIRGMKEACERLEDEGLGHIRLCPETMGRPAQIGDLDEICRICEENEKLIPCIDFAHLHALSGGSLREQKDFEKVLDTLESRLGTERARGIHVHFSAIEYTASGEKRHRTFAETEYGPHFDQLAPLLVQRRYEPFVICERHGTMAEDALEMKMTLEKQS